MKKLVTKIFALGVMGLLSFLLFACLGNHGGGLVGTWYRYDNDVRTNTSKQLNDDWTWTHTQLGDGYFKISGNTIEFLNSVGQSSDWTVFRIGTITNFEMQVENKNTGTLAIYRKELVVADYFTITFVTDGGTTVAPISVPISTIVEAPSAPTRPGYLFVGWNDINGIRKNFPFLLNENITLYAVWEVDVHYDFITACGLHYSVVDNEIVIIGLNHTAGRSINIPDFISGLPVTRIEEYAFAFSQITDVTIPETVTTIGIYAFWANPNLTRVVLNEGLQIIEDGAFAETYIQEITIPSTVTTIGNQAFIWNWNLTSVTLNEGLQIIGDEAFSSTAIYSIEVPSTVTRIGVATFVNNPNLETLILNEGLKSIDLFAFAWTNIAQLVMPSTLISIGESAFADIWNLTSVTLNDGLQIIGDRAFSNTRISEILIPSTVTNIGWRAFDESVVIICDVTNARDLSVRVVDNEIWITGLATNQTSIIIPAFIGGLPVTRIDNWAFAWSNIISIVIPSTVTHIATHAFTSSHDLNSLTLNEGLQTIGNWAFADTAINELIIPSTVTNIGFGAFAYTNNLTTVTLNEGLSIISSYTFAFSNISEIIMPSTVVSIGNEAFWQIESLVSVILNEGLQIIGDEAFWGTSITEVIIPSSVVSVGEHAFGANVKIIYYSDTFDHLLYEIVDNEVWIIGLRIALTTINIPSYINGLPVTRIDDVAFAWSNITSVIIPSTVRSIGIDAFVYSRNLTNVTLNEGLQIIGDWAFAGTNIKEVIIPSTVTNIGWRAFDSNVNIIWAP